uniref:K Homology domain-containing protein n=1 Tax=Noctiluca scintillans TaxID=2966 RepID=A0A7S1EVN7_NOCSC|mmetsp:Transcript_11273/g.31313  ORF Transcript_11273/g.31313 Transcript_11273/m.31313 type:complete len:979 (+) Transcript_11273:96-3032(+)
MARKKNNKTVGEEAAAPPPKATEEPLAPQAVPEPAAPKAEAKGKAKAKAEPKVEVKPEPTVQPKAEAKAKATSAPKAEAKAGAKAKAKAEAQAKAEPSPVPVASTEGLEDTTDAAAAKKKKKRNKKKAEGGADGPNAEEVEEAEAARRAAAEMAAEREHTKSKHAEKHSGLADKIRSDLKDLADANVNPSSAEIQEQRKKLDSLLKDVDETVKTVKVPRPKAINTAALMQSIRELKICADDSTYSEGTREAMLGDAEAALQKALAFEAFTEFRKEMAELKELVEARIKENDELMRGVKSGNAQRRIMQRVAQAKGLKVEELNEKEVSNVNVDLPPDITSISWLPRRFEQEYNVVIDRSDAVKGAGKGVNARPPTGLVVRGLESDVTVCVAALKALDLKERKAVPGTTKQIAVIMGAQQAGARKLEQEFKGVFVHSEKDKIQLYGPKKAVTSCLAHVQTLLVEDSAAPPLPGSVSITVDKDKARALIGADGKNVKKIEADTGTSIKVNIQKDKEDETTASVRINGDAASLEKAKTQINAFVKGLESCLVKGDSELVSRLYDGANIRKGGGKSNGKGKGESNSKFGELRDSSGLTVVRKTNGILLVGDKADVEKWKCTLEECIKVAGMFPASVKLSADQTRLWTSEKVEALSTSSGAKVTLVKQGRGEALLEIAGTDEEKELAKQSITTVHDDMGEVETLDDVPPAGVKSLTAKGAGRLRDVEKQFGVSVALDRKTHGVRIVGSKGAAPQAKEAIQKIIDDAENTVTKEIDIEWAEGGAIIGRSGVTVRQIKQATNLDDLQITIGDETSKTGKKVVLRGSAEAVEAATILVQETLARAREPEAPAAVEKPKTNAGSSGPATAAAAEPSEEVAETSSANSAPQPEASSAAAPDAKPTTVVADPAKKAGKGSGKVQPKMDVNIKSEEFFPSLGGGDGEGSKKKVRPKSSAWKTGGDEAHEEESAAEERGAEADETTPEGDQE